MNEPAEKTWWEPHSPAYDARRTARLRDALLTLIERDVSFSLDALAQGYDYPGGVRLESLVVEQDEEADQELADDWFFTLEGPPFRVVLIAVGRVRGEDGPRVRSLLRHPMLDEVAGEEAALAWLAAPPLPEGRGYR